MDGIISRGGRESKPARTVLDPLDQADVEQGIAEVNARDAGPVGE